MDCIKYIYILLEHRFLPPTTLKYLSYEALSILAISVLQKFPLLSVMLIALTNRSNSLNEIHLQGFSLKSCHESQRDWLYLLFHFLLPICITKAWLCLWSLIYKVGKNFPCVRLSKRFPAGNSVFQLCLSSVCRSKYFASPFFINKKFNSQY